MFGRVAQVSFAGVSIQPITDLRIVFAVDKHDGQELNRAIIRIYNLNATARSQLAKPFPLGYALVEPVIRVFLNAGYQGDAVQMIAGELLSATNQKDGPDWITELEVWSGINAATKNTANISIGQRTNAKVIADRLLNALGIDIQYTTEAEAALGKQQVTDYTAFGLAFRETAAFLRRYGLAFTIEEDGQGLVYVDDQPRNPEATKTQANTFSPDSGLVGAPAITRTGIEFRALLRPQIKLLERVFVDSQTISGTLRGDVSADYHVINVRHIGDTRGDDWYTEIEGAYSNIIEGTYE